MEKIKSKEPLLILENVSKSFMGLKAVNDLSMCVPRGGIVGLIGPNGAGKSTCFNLITKLIENDSGIISFAGNNLNKVPTHTIAQMGIGRTFQNIRLFNNLSVLENILVPLENSAAYNISDVVLNRKRYQSEKQKNIQHARNLLSETQGLYERAGDRADSLPYGLQRKLEICRALALEPQILLMDEPAAGMNGTEKEELKTYIGTILKKGISILLIEHDMSFVMGICERIVVLNFGTKIAEGSPREIQSNPTVIEAYLGESDNAIH